MNQGYDIVVCGSIVPDPLQTLEPEMGPDGPTIKNEMMLPSVLDPWAAHSLYEAAHLAGKTEGSRVFLMSMGPKAKLQQLMMAVGQKASFELVVIDGPAGGFVDAAETAAALSAAIEGIPELDRSRLLLFGGCSSASRDAGVTLQMVGEKLRITDVESVAVCLLFSFMNPAHEQIITQALRQAGFTVSASCEVLPEFREYERTSTTVINAYVSPIVDRYLGGLEERLEVADFHIMQSNGGSIRATDARAGAVRSILSGPAGGVVGAFNVAQTAGFEQIISFDMGGTSTDVSLCDGAIRVTNEAEIDGFPIRVPVIDIHTVGSGGGSIAYVDAGGALRVGPKSAGADPGPVCYGRGGIEPTVTDANLILGRLAPDHFLGGRMELDIQAAGKTLESLARKAGLTAREVSSQRWRGSPSGAKQPPPCSARLLRLPSAARCREDSSLQRNPVPTT